MVLSILIELEEFFKQIYLTWTSIATRGQSGPGSNVSEMVLHTPQISKTETSTSEAI